MNTTSLFLFFIFCEITQQNSGHENIPKTDKWV